MQLGTRWAFGAEPPARLPAPVIEAIRKVEADAVGDGVRPGGTPARWTLTWLEGNPVLELDPLSAEGSVTTMRYRAREGIVTIGADDLDEFDDPD